MKTKLILGLLILIVFILSGCIDKKDPVSVSTHPEGWAKEASANFHGEALLGSSFKLESCQSCHGEDYKGGSSGVACSDCHTQYPHPDGWVNEGSSIFHGKQLLDGKLSLDYCQDCHGENYQGGSSGVACGKCHAQFPHPAGWVPPNGDNFHGKLLLFGVYDLQYCQDCHGTDFAGGSSGIACAQCHESFPHPQGFAETSSDNFHGNYIETNLHWDILSCQSCHGEDYAGRPFAEKNCLKCHTAPGGPEACNTCHGSENNPAPPEDLAGNMSTSVITVGAHQAHVTGSTWSTVFQNQCRQCHTPVNNYSDASHIDDTPGAEINFGSLATGNGQYNTLWDGQAGSCDNAYCHGAFEFRKSESSYQWAYADSIIAGNNPRLFWQYSGTGQAFCGTCHGLPPKGHIAAQTCEGCHAGVVDENFNIINKHLHINGTIDVFGTELTENK